jgi:maltooligosyltrehalose trehalohydrolase
LSAVDDPAQHEWTDGDWSGIQLPGGVIYELHIGTFTPEGTFGAAIERLDDLADLGVTAVELMPVAEAMGRRGWGYDGVDLWATHHAYGGPTGLRTFVDAAHARGLGVLLDVVYNHLGPEGSYLDRFGPYFTDRHHTPWGPAVNLDGPASTEVRRFIVDNAVHWCAEQHLDGLRIDATHHLLDDRPVHIVGEISGALAELSAQTGWRRWVVVEREQHELLPLLDGADGGWGVDARWADDLHHALHAHLTGETDGYYAAFGRLGDIGTALAEGQVRPGDPAPPTMPLTRFVTCSQNHDQIGNRARGERLAHLVGVPAALAAATLVLLGPGTPLLFQGEEWAASAPFPFFCDTNDDDLARAIREGRRAEFEGFGWDADSILDPLDVTTAQQAILDWPERSSPHHAAVLDWYRTLIHLRAAEPALHTGDRSTTHVHVDEDAGTVVMHRGPFAVVANLSPASAAAAVGGELLCSIGEVTTSSASVCLAPYAAAVLRVSPRPRSHD